MMKKNKIKKIITFGVLLLFSSLLLWNCETEEEILSPVNNQTSLQKVDRHLVRIDHLSDHHKGAYEILNKLFKSASDKISRTEETYSEEHNLFYTLNEVYLIEGDEYEQISFAVRTPNLPENQFQNYLLMVYPDNGFEHYLVTYQYDTPERDSFQNIGIQELQGSQLYSRYLNCPNAPQLIPMEVERCTFTNCTGQDSSGGWVNHGFGDESCRCGISLPCSPPTKECSTEIIYALGCGGGSTGGDDGSSNDPNNDNGQTGGGDQNGDQTSGNDGVPVVPIAENLRLNTFILSLDAEKRAWWDDPVNFAMVHQLKRHLIDQDYSELAKEYVTGSIELEQIANCESTQYTSCITLYYNPGKINNRNEFSYTHIGTDGAKTAYKLTTGELVVSSPSKLIINGSENGIWTSEVSNTKYYYIKVDGKWAQLLIKENVTSLADELKSLFHLAALDLGRFLGTYVVPFEDIKILITGTDFDGEPANRWLAAGMLLTEVVAVGKIFKVVKVVVQGTDAWRVVRKIGNKTYTRVVNKLSDTTLDLYQTFSRNTQDLVDQAHRSGEVLDDVVEEAAEVLEDEFINKGSKLDWSEIRALWRRGNDFNRRAIDQEWYDYHEIHLVNGKRLDSYDPFIGEIVSRKATDLNNIQFSTFVNYLKEFTNKYKVGTQIRSNKYPDIDGDVLEGVYYLEIPNSNQSLSNIQDYIDYAWDNYQVRLRFRPE
jgi:hypothetical protein